jgi:hypothetical protein
MGFKSGPNDSRQRYEGLFKHTIFLPQMVTTLNLIPTQMRSFVQPPCPWQQTPVVNQQSQHWPAFVEFLQALSPKLFPDAHLLANLVLGDIRPSTTHSSDRVILLLVGSLLAAQFFCRT